MRCRNGNLQGCKKVEGSCHGHQGSKLDPKILYNTSAWAQISNHACSRTCLCSIVIFDCFNFSILQGSLNECFFHNCKIVPSLVVWKRQRRGKNLCYSGKSKKMNISACIS